MEAWHDMAWHGLASRPGPGRGRMALGHTGPGRERGALLRTTFGPLGYQAMLGQARPGQAMPGQARPGHVRPGQARRR
jgi:hypothetical protein